MLLQFRIVPDGGTVVSIDCGAGTFDFQAFHPAIGRVLYRVVALPDRARRQIFCCKLGFVGRFGAHIFLFHLPDFTVGRQIHRPSSLQPRLRHRVFPTARFYLVLKTQRMPYLASHGVKLPVDPGAALLWQVCFGLFQLFAQDFRLSLCMGSPFLRRKVQPLTFGCIIRVIDIALSLHRPPPYAARSEGFVVITR